MFNTPPKQAPTRRSDLQPTIHLSSDLIQPNQAKHLEAAQYCKSLTPLKRSRFPKTQSTPKRSIFVPSSDRFLRLEGLEQLRVNRARLMDWFMEIFAVFGVGWEGFWLTV